MENQNKDVILYALNTKRITLPLVYFMQDRLVIDTDIYPYREISEIAIQHKATMVTTGSVCFIYQHEAYFFLFGKKEEGIVNAAIAMVQEIIQNKSEPIDSEDSDEIPSQIPFSPADEILKYKNLLDLGAITPEEYEKKKNQLLEM